jgi:hypothetical protein
MDKLTRYNWTIAKILMAAVLTLSLLAGVGFVGLVGYTAYVAAANSSQKKPQQEKWDIIWESPSKNVNR